MPLLLELPDELLSDIVDRAYATSPETLPNIGSTCKKLQRLTHPLQWRDIVLPWKLNQKSAIARFVEAHKGNENIRSIRLQPQPSVMNAFRVGMKVAHGHVDALCKCLNNLANLTIFSICLEDEVDSCYRLHGAALTRVVRALPPSILHLELDTQGIDSIAEDLTPQPPGRQSRVNMSQPPINLAIDVPNQYPEDHLCHAISDRVPQLESLRLQLSCLCTGLFRSLSQSSDCNPKSQLRRAYIRLNKHHSIARSIGVRAEVSDCALLKSQGSLENQVDFPAVLGVETVMRHLLDLQAAGGFPQLQRFIVWHRGGDNEGQHYLIRDIATRSTTHVPRYAVPDLGPGWEADFGEENFEPVCWVRDHDRRDWFGYPKKLEKAMSHEVEWRETPDGVRLPPSRQLGSETTRLCADGLVSLEYIREKERQEMASGNLTQPKLPEPVEFSTLRVFVERHE